MSKIPLILIGALSWSWALIAKDIRVPEDDETIQSAIDSANAGDTILVAPGTYRERIQLRPAIVLRSAGPDKKGDLGLKRAEATVIDGNTCFENFFAGIGHNGADPLVTRNICYGNVRAGIGVSEGASPVVRKNRCYQNRRAGIGIRTGADTRPVIEDNDCYENEMTGIGADEEAAPIVRGNRCYRNKLTGIGCREHSSALIVENHCYENQAAGIGVASANPSLLRNRIEKNEAAAIGITGGSAALLQKNTLVRTGGMPPIVAISPGGKADLVENTVKGGGVGGIVVSGRLDAIANVLVSQNGGSGFFIRENGEATLVENRITGYKNPVRDEGAKTVIIEGKAKAKETRD